MRKKRFYKGKNVFFILFFLHFTEKGLDKFIYEYFKPQNSEETSNVAKNIKDKLKDKFGQDPGFKVPDGYFDEIFTKISDSLPERTIEKPMPLTMWQRVRPYVYLAAMFAGIWCMMKMFHTMTTMPDVSLDNPPQVVAEALAHPENADELASVENVNDYELISEIAKNILILRSLRLILTMN